MSLHDVSMLDADAWVCGDAGTLLHSVDTGATWNKVVVPTTANLFSYGAYSDGSHDTRFLSGDGGAILRSTDAGVTWQVKHTGSESLLSMGVVDGPTSPTFVAAGNDGSDAIVLVSTDGMESWQRHVIKSGATIHAAAFADGDSFAVGPAGLVMESTDAITWTPMTAQPTSADLRAIDAFAPTIVGDGVIIQRTNVDGLVTWGKLADNALPDLADIADSLAIGTGGNGDAQLLRLGAAALADPYTIEDLGITTQLDALAHSAGGTIIAVGEAGTIVVRPPAT